MQRSQLVVVVHDFLNHGLDKGIGWHHQLECQPSGIVHISHIAVKEFSYGVSDDKLNISSGKRYFSRLVIAKSL